MKKVYLTIEWRDRIVNDLLSCQSRTEAAIKEKPQSQTVAELAEQANQERQMLVDLLAVSETERA